MPIEILMGRRPWGKDCTWFDPDALRCVHYELRPQTCRDFEPGGEYCGQFRRGRGIDPPVPGEVLMEPMRPVT